CRPPCNLQFRAFHADRVTGARRPAIRGPPGSRRPQMLPSMEEADGTDGRNLRYSHLAPGPPRVPTPPARRTGPAGHQHTLDHPRRARVHLGGRDAAPPLVDPGRSSTARGPGAGRVGLGAALPGTDVRTRRLAG